ncbi:hypothetical protein NIES25_30150 [Nostoc linckia NIES-25]|nr:hypothetical protein NIES25_30150 [Nostoc linckia NIES-25]
MNNRYFRYLLRKSCLYIDTLGLKVNSTKLWVYQTRRQSLQREEPQRELFMGETPKTTLAPQRAGS